MVKVAKMEIKILAVCLIHLSMLYTNEALRILVVFPLSSKSHSILGHGVANNLLEAGHEVVIFTSYPRSEAVPNLTEIDCSPIGLKFKEDAEKSDTFKLKNLIGKGNVGNSAFFMYFIYEFNKMFLEFEPVAKFLSNPKEKFDLVILEWFFSETVAGIPPLFQCPYIWIGSTEAHGYMLRIIDEVPNPAYSADLFTTSLPPFDFWERAGQLVHTIWRHLALNLIVAPFENSLYNRVFSEIAAKRGITMPSYVDAAHNASMILVNSDPSVGTPFRLPQNVRYIGGYHIDRKMKPLPKDLEKIMVESKHGVIYFSMGSNLQSKDMSKEMKESLVKMFGKLKEDVIWKFEDDMENVPSNLHLVKWAPQLSILAHPKLKLFITHGGQLSTTEAIHFGVPIIGLPVLGDQYLNMKSVEKKGFGIMLTLSEDFSDDLRLAIEKILGNPEYKNKAKFLSSVFHDRLATPGKELVHWVEHVVKTGGAPHLRSPAFQVPWYQKMYFDLAAVLILIVTPLYLGWKVWKNKNHKKEKKN